MSTDLRLLCERFPRSSKYHPDWLIAGLSGGANPLWLAEWLAESLELRPGMRVLDLGCGRAMSSIFLHQEYGVQVWATDLWFSVSENLQRIRDAAIDDGVFPIHADARSLPFADQFFDAVVAIDSFFYYGTDDHYLGYLARFLKPGGQLGIAGAGLMREVNGVVPKHLQAWWTPDLWCLHSADWWRRHWGQTGFVDVECADSLPDGWKYWLDWQNVICPDNTLELQSVQADGGENIGYVRAVCRLHREVALPEQVSSVAMQYVKQPCLRVPAVD